MEDWKSAIEGLKELIVLRNYTGIDVNSITFDPSNNFGDQEVCDIYSAMNTNNQPVLIILYRSTTETKSKSTKPRDPNKPRKFNTADMNFISGVIQEENRERATEKQTVYYADIILVSNRKGTNKKTPTLIKDNDYRDSLWMFHINELKVNITTHFLQPKKFEIIPSSVHGGNIKKFFESRSIKPHQIGTISIHEPLGKWYGIKHGQLVMVEDDVYLAGLLVKKMVTWMIVVDKKLPPRK